MFQRLAGLFMILACGAILLSCQSDTGIPLQPDRTVDLTAATTCTDATFTVAAAIYTDAGARNSKLRSCKTIQSYVQRGQIGSAELEIDKLLAAIHDDYQSGAAGLASVGGQTLTQSVASYIGAACALAPLSDDECLVPNDVDESGFIEDSDLDGWIAAGPLSGSATSLAKDGLANHLFGFGVEGGPAFIIAVQRQRTEIDGPCPETFAFDCQDDVYDLDVDKVPSKRPAGPVFVTVESCTDFGSKHAHCPEGQGCAHGVTASPVNWVQQSACDDIAYREMGLWGKFAYQAIRPSLWIVHATPAYAATSTKFGAFSPIVLADEVPRTRGVDCIITESQFNSGSEGSTCRLFSGGTQIDQCVTFETGSNSSQCPLTPAIPADITVLITVEKNAGNGQYSQTPSDPFLMGPAHPARGEANLKVCFELSNDVVGEVPCPS